MHCTAKNSCYIQDIKSELKKIEQKINHPHYQKHRPKKNKNKTQKLI